MDGCELKTNQSTKTFFENNAELFQSSLIEAPGQRCYQKYCPESIPEAFP